MDFVWPESEFDQYGVLVVPHQQIVSPALAKKLEKYVAAGGILVLGALAGVKDENCHIVERTAPGLLAKLAGMLAAGRLEIPIAEVYPLADVRDAYRDLEQRHTQGKIVLEP